MPVVAGAQTAPRPDADPRIEKIVAAVSEQRLNVGGQNVSNAAVPGAGPAPAAGRPTRDK